MLSHRFITLALALAVALALAPAAGANRLVQLPGAAGCYRTVAAADCTVTPVGNGRSILVRGAHAYASSQSDDMIRVYDRNTTTGALTWRGSNAAGCIADVGGPCADGRALVDPIRMAMSPDGTKLYVTVTRGVVALTRDPATGNLTQSDAKPSCVTFDGTGGLCNSAPVIQTVHSLTVSPDNSDVYVAGQGVSDGNIGWVTLLDVVSGGLEQHAAGSGGCAEDVVANGCLNARALKGARVPRVSPDGKHVYVSAAASSSVVAFTRAGDGALGTIGGPDGCLATTGQGEGCRETGLLSNQVMPLAFASDTRLYTGALEVGSVVQLTRDSTTGGLTTGACAAASNGGAYAACAQYANGFGLIDFALSPDGKNLISASRFGRGLRSFALAADGAPTPVADPNGCLHTGGIGFSTTCNVPRGFARSSGSDFGPDNVAMSDDGKFVYGSSPPELEDGAGIVAASRDTAGPICQDATLNVNGGDQASIPVKCTDADGDAITIAIAAAPTRGVTGAVDQAAQTLPYAAPAGFTGTETLTFKGTANGLESAVAIVTINISSPPVVNPTPTPTPTATVTPPKPERILSPVRSAFTVFAKKYTVIKRMQIVDIPDGATVTILCSGKKCAFKKKTFKPSKGRVDARKALKKAKLRKGAKLEVQITKPGMIGKSVLYAFNGKSVPRGQTLCLPVGSTKRSKCPV